LFSQPAHRRRVVGDETIISVMRLTLTLLLSVVFR
jgi:hypothetical protein